MSPQKKMKHIELKEVRTRARSWKRENREVRVFSSQDTEVNRAAIMVSPKIGRIRYRGESKNINRMIKKPPTPEPIMFQK
jgi:hypothetical protein